MKYECPRLSLLTITPVLQANQIGQSPIVLFHANVFRATACLEHSNLLKVTSWNSDPKARSPQEDGPRQCKVNDQTDGTRPKSNYELFNCNNLNIRYWSWNYRGCWHQTCPPIDPR